MSLVLVPHGGIGGQNQKEYCIALYFVIIINFFLPLLLLFIRNELYNITSSFSFLLSGEVKLICVLLKYHKPG